MKEEQPVTTTSDSIALHLSDVQDAAALLTGKLNVTNSRVRVVISGGNVGIQRFCTLYR